MSRCTNLIGQVFGRWTVIKRSENNIHGGSRWFCRCSCGGENTINASYLKSGRSLSCGCYHKEVVCLPEGEASCRIVYSSYKREAKKRKLSFELTIEEFKKITKLCCHYCGIDGSPFGYRGARTNGTYIGNGIDRKDNTTGYVFENCLPCCAWCNRMKLDKTYEEFISHLQTIMKHMGKA